MAANVITAAAIKGGVGKTATVWALAHAAAADGKKVLCIDLDPQCSLTICMEGKPLVSNVFEVIEGNTSAADAIQATPGGIDLLAGHANLAQLTTGRGSGRRLAEAIKPLKRKYDLILIDTSPAMGEALLNGLLAATGILIPLVADAPSLQAYYQVNELLDVLQITRHRVIGIVLTSYNKRVKFQEHLAGVMAGKCRVLGTIRRSTALPEAIGFKKSLFKYAPKSTPAVDYLALYRKLRKELWS